MTTLPPALRQDRDTPDAPVRETVALNIRPYRGRDRDALEEIFLAARRQAFYWRAPHQFRREDLAAATANELIWVADWNGRVAGFISIWAPASFVHNLFVDPDFQGVGIGSALLLKAVDLVPLPLTLKCKTRNRRACQFYERRGWRPIRGEGKGHGRYWIYRLDRPMATVPPPSR